jgi:hypothetical protein
MSKFNGLRSLWDFWTKEPSFIIKKDGDYTVATDGDGQNRFADKDPAVVMQNALDSLTDGGRVFIKKGLYVLKSKRQIPWTGVTLYACIVPKYSYTELIAEKGTVLKLGDNVGGSVIGVAENCSHVRIEGVEIDGNNANNPDTGVDGDLCGIITASPAEYLTVKDIYVHHTTREGFYLHTGWGHLENLMARYCGQSGIVLDAMDYFNAYNLKVVYGGLHGIYIIGATSKEVRQFNIIGAEVYGVQGYGIFLRYVVGGKVIGGEARHCGFGNVYTAGIMIRDCEEVDLIGCKGFESYETGLWLYDVNKINVIGGVFKNNSQRSAGYAYGVQLYNAVNCKLIGVTVRDTQASKTQKGILEYGSSDYNLIFGCDVVDNLTPLISLVGANTKVRNCRGYVTENKGTATIPANSTSVTVAHGLAGTPSKVVVTPRGNIGSVWVSARDATNITINCSTAPTTSVVVDWEAEL